MKLITELHTTKVLHVKVPDTVDNDELEADLGMCLEYDRFPSLKDGTTIDATKLADSYEGGEDWHEGVKPLIEACLAIQPQPDEFFFHL